jgi:hypothetical protein
MAVSSGCAHTGVMTGPSLGEIAITTTLFSIYLGARGAGRTLGALQYVIGPRG